MRHSETELQEMSILGTILLEIAKALLASLVIAVGVNLGLQTFFNNLDD